MSAVIRIKRHIDEEPLSAFLLNCKKRKTSETQVEEAAGGSTKENDVGSSTQILKFSGTLSKAEDISEHILKMSKDEAKDIVAKTARTPKITEKSRTEAKTHSQNNRFKIVNCTRGLEQATGSSSTAKSLTILDVEKEENDKGVSQSGPKIAQSTDTDDDKFVFDVYVPENHYSNNECTSSDNLLNFDDISVVEYVQDYYSSYRETGMEDSDNDSEDSNDENNWRNEYPDSEDMGDGDNSSVGEADMRRAMKDFDIDGDRELSSDDEIYDDDARGHSDGFVYSIDSEAIGFEDDLDYCDVNRYGEAYARYKQRILKNADNNYLPQNYVREDEESDNGSEYSD